MANIKISELPTATTLLNADEFPLNQGGTTKKSTIGQIKNSVGGFPTGGVLMFAASGVPAGWLECDGSILPINSYTELHNVVGQNFKKAGTTFNTLTGFQIPDMRGLFVRGWNHGRQTGGDTVINRGFGTTQLDEFKSHRHELLTVGYPGLSGVVPVEPLLQEYYINSNWTEQQIRASGGDETRPRNIALIYCIKT